MKKILLIDNSSVIINVLEDLSSMENDFKVYSAKSYSEAKELIEKYDFFVSISNIVLPDALNGEIIDLLKEKNIPTIVLTSKMDNNLIKKIRESNIVNYTSKDSIYELESAYKLAKLLTFIEGIEVLIVDDSNVIVSKVKTLLESLLLKVHVAKNGEEALEILEENSNISLIITDYYMDKMDGLEFVKKARKKQCYVKTPIMIMTSDANDQLKIKFFKNGVSDFLIKPILEEELKSKVINIFSNMKHISDIQWFNKIVNENVITSSTDEKGIIKHVSKAFCEISGYEEKELVGNNHRILRHPDMPKTIFEELWGNIKNGKKWQGEIKNLRKDGSYYWVKVIIEPNFDNEGNIIGFSSVRQDITDKKRIYEISITDGLTSLYNRRYFNDISSSLLKNNVRDNKTFGFLLLDIDNFKKYNDTYGHQAGDEVLISVSKALHDTFKRDEDFIFRLGGEEFGVILSTKKREDMIALAHKAKENIENLNIKHELNIPYMRITASFGLTVLDKENDVDDLNMDAIYKMSDYLLYKAKDQGRNRVVCKD